MRPRNKKHATERISNCAELLIKDPKLSKNKWHEVFNNNNPIHLEIGCGKGSFICAMAKNNPNINFVAFEKEEMVIISALELCKSQNIKNVRFCIFDACGLCDCFANGELSCIYLNFSDPWKKTRHIKRRLTHPNFLKLYKAVLQKNSPVIFKTDNKELFDYSLKQFSLENFELKNITYDLHQSEFNKDNIQTEYEQKFSSLGYKINKVEAYSK